MSRRIWLIAAVAIFPFLPKAAEADPWTITVVGTIFAETVPDQNGLFGPVGASLVGYGYSETITTNPLLNTGVVDSTPTLLERDGGVVIGCCGAPYTVTMTVNGVSYTQTESNPFLNRSYLISGLAMGLTSQDQVYQEVDSAGCVAAYGQCTDTYLLAYSTQIPLVPRLDFDLHLLATDNRLNTDSNIFFSFRNGLTAEGSMQSYTTFYGSIERVSVNVPEPPSFTILLSGLGMLFLGFGFLRGGLRSGQPPS
jgi:PEP-CTERM motif-containing protein